MVETLRVSKLQARSVVAAAMLLFATVVPALASAAQVTERSIALSSSAAGATGVSYQVKFTSVGAGGGLVLDFCSNSPLVGEACTAPTGFSVSSATTATSGWTRTVVDANTLKLTGTIGATTAITVDVDNVTNPAANGPLYARIVTYAASGDLANYTDAETLGANVVDTGGVAMSIANKVAVTAAVLESMTFCVSKAAPTANCGGVTAPTLELGEDVGDGVIALTSSAVSTGNIFTQISTNAASGAIVNLKSNALNCGGLLRAGAPSACDIAPAGGSGTIAANEAKFGVKAAASADPSGATNPNGTFQVKSGTGYDGTNYRLNALANNTTGVTSTYGDPFLDTNSAPINNRNMELTFAASVSNNTPAGKYSADLSLIATGKF